MTINTINTVFPVAPDPALDDNPTFATKSALFTAAIKSFGSEMIPIVPQMNNDIASANLAATTAVNAPGAAGTSTTSLTIGTGAQTFTTQTGKNWQVGQPIMIASTASPTNWMAGTCTAYNSGTGAMTVNCALTNGAGTLAVWTVSLCGPIVAYPGGSILPTGGTGTAYTITPTPAIVAYGAGQQYYVQFSAASGANPTLQINSVATPPNLVRQQEDGSYVNINGEIPLNHRSRVTLISSTQALVEELPPQNISPLGQCRLTKSGANLLLSRFAGNKLFINGSNQTIPAAGVTLAPPATTLTNYFIYAFMNAGVMTLEASATGHSTDATWGHEIKTGDATRVLVGQARTVTSAWVDSTTQRFVVSYHNRRNLDMANGPVTVSAINTTSAERTTANRCEFLTWADEAVQAGIYGNITDTAGSGSNFVEVGVDGAAVTQDITAFNSTAGASVPYSAIRPITLAEGYHYSSTHARSSATSTTSLTGSNTAVIRG